MISTGVMVRLPSWLLYSKALVTRDTELAAGGELREGTAQAESIRNPTAISCFACFFPQISSETFLTRAKINGRPWKVSASPLLQTAKSMLESWIFFGANALGHYA